MEFNCMFQHQKSTALILCHLKGEPTCAMDGPRTLSKMTSMRVTVSKSLTHIFQLNTLKEWGRSLMCMEREPPCPPRYTVD